jgi:ABC-type lipoprotein release transport system permease subunit
MKIFRMAWRNIWRNSRRTAVTIGAMTLAVFAMILVASMANGYLANMERRIVDIELGDLQIHSADYRNKPSIYSVIERPQGLLESLGNSGFKAAPRLLGGALVAANNESAGVSMRGIEPDLDREVSGVFSQVAQGKWLSRDDPTGVVLGRKLARTLRVGTGDELVVLSQATDGSMANDLFFVRGVLATTSDATDRAGVFLIADTFREFFLMPDGVHQVLVRRPPGSELALATAAAAELAPGLDVKSWKQLMPTLATIIDSAQIAFMGVMLIMYMVIAIIILNATLMAVFERVREFGVLKAIGVDPGSVMKLILLETGIQTLLACATGVTLSIPALWYLSTIGLNTGEMGGASMAGMTFDPYMRAIVTPASYSVPVSLLVIIVFIGAIYPAIKAARILPVEAMRYH